MSVSERPGLVLSSGVLWYMQPCCVCQVHQEIRFGGFSSSSNPVSMGLKTASVAWEVPFLLQIQPEQRVREPGCDDHSRADSTWCRVLLARTMTRRASICLPNPDTRLSYVRTALFFAQGGILNNLPPEQLQSFDAVMVRPRTLPPAGSSASDTSAEGGSSDSTVAAPGLNVEGAPDDLKGSGIGGDEAPSEQQQRQTGHVLSTCAVGAKASGCEEAGAGSGVTSAVAGTPATNASGGASEEGGGGGGMTITVSQAGGMVPGCSFRLFCIPEVWRQLQDLRESPRLFPSTLSRTCGCVAWPKGEARCSWRPVALVTLALFFLRVIPFGCSPS